MRGGISKSLAAVRVALDPQQTPGQAVRWLRGEDRAFTLSGEWLGFGHVTLLGSAPIRVADAERDDPFDLIDQQPAVAPGDALVGGGWVGWLGYGLGSRLEQLPAPPPAPVPRPGFSMAFYDHMLVHDGERWWFEALYSDARQAALDQRLALWNERLRATEPRPREACRLGNFSLGPTGASGHIAAGADCVERIHAGELFQANICLRLQADVDGDALHLLSDALKARPRFGALVDGALSLSPERFLRRAGRQVQTMRLGRDRFASGQRS